MAKQSQAPKQKGAFKEKLDKFFEITKRGSNFKTEIIAGLTTFFAMAYIVATNPNQVVGFMHFENTPFQGEFQTIWYSVYVASILVAVVGTLLFALYAKMPFAQACGMGLNSFFFTSFILPEFLKDNDIQIMKAYKEGLAVILLSGIIFMILSFTGLRTYVAKALPDCLKKAVPAGIGLFIAFLGFQNVGIIQANQYTLVQFFDFHSIFSAMGKPLADVSGNAFGMYVSLFSNKAFYDNAFDFSAIYNAGTAAGASEEAVEACAQLLQSTVVRFIDAWRLAVPVVIAILGLIVMGVLTKKNVKGSVIITILGSTFLYYLLTWSAPNFEFQSIGKSFVAFGEEGIFGAFEGFKTLFTTGGKFTWGTLFSVIGLVITFTLVDMFDTMGTLYGAASQANMLDANGDPQNLEKSMNSDSIATVSGALLGTSTCTTFVESSAGVGVGGRTGFASLITSACFFLCLFLTPLAAIIPTCATAPALMFIGVLMLKGFKNVDMDDISSAIPAFLTLVMMPLTYSISNGIAIGAISYVLIKLFTGKYQKKDIAVTVVAVLFALRFVLVPNS